MDVGLIRTCGILDTLVLINISVMADRGFTIKDMQKELLNIPPNLEGHHQLPATEVEQGKKIVSLQIHVE